MGQAEKGDCSPLPPLHHPVATQAGSLPAVATSQASRHSSCGVATCTRETEPRPPSPPSCQSYRTSVLCFSLPPMLCSFFHLFCNCFFR